MRPRLLAPLATLASIALAGCNGEHVGNAGLTNGPPPSAVEKAGVRNDLPALAAPDDGEALGQAGDHQTNAGTGGVSGSDPDMASKGASADSDTVRANPPAKGSTDPSSAAGGTKPAGGRINTGTPRSPQ